MLHRRTTLAVLASFLIHQTTVSAARAQGILLSKVPWKTIIEGVAAAVTAIEIWTKIQPERGEAQDPSCVLQPGDIAVVNRMCRQLALSVNTKDFEASAEPGDGGLIAALHNYIDNPNRSNWLRLRNIAMQFLAEAGDLFRELSKPSGIVDKLNADAKAQILARLRQALFEIEPALQLLHYDRREANTSDRGAAQEILERVSSLPRLVQEGVQASQDLMDRRSAARCK